MRIQIVQHSAADSPAAILPMLEQLGHHVSTVRLDRGDLIPEDFDAEVLMTFGGGISLTSKELPAWVEAERRLIRRFVKTDRRVLGVCLGAQLLASALGAAVKRNPEPEVGWHLISRAAGSPRSGVGASLPDSMMAFHWHQDTFDIPVGASRLYESEACQNQAFAMGDRVFAFQFHFEANERTVMSFLAVSKLFRRQALYVQSESQITEGIERYLTEQNERLRSFLEAFVPV